MPDTSLLYVLRHGLTDSNIDNRFAGWSDDALNETGRAQCEDAAERLGGDGIRRVFTSPVRRATETARILADTLGATVRTVHDLHEIELGPWKGLTETEAAERFPDVFRRWRETPDALELDGRERLSDVRDRAVKALNQIGRSLVEDEEDVPAAVVTHKALIRVLWLTALGRPLSEYHQVETPYCAPFPIRWEGRDRIEAAGGAPT